jgi:bacillithiol system protein YtxJ
MIHECKNEDDYRQIVDNSKSRTVLLFKHSTTCPISRGAWERFTAFMEQHPEIEYWRVLVRDNKELAVYIAEKTDIRHESPQVILFHQGKAIWKCSYHSINEANIKRQLERLPA